MKKTFQGYYRPTSEEFASLWKTGLIVPDANVLLTLYRLGDATRKRLLEIFRAFESQLFLPYQAGFEFQTNRLGTIHAQTAAYEKVLDELRAFPGQLSEGLREHPRLERSDLKSRVTDALAPVIAHISSIRDEHPNPLGEDVIGSDAIRDILDEVFAGRVGPQRNLAEVAKEGAARYERRQPPGYEDRTKNGDAKYGDLAIWLDIMDAAKEYAKDVIFVTADRKEDWWWIRDGKRISARPELVAEMQDVAKQTAYFYDIKRFMEEASEFLGLGEVSDDERQDVARAQEAGQAPKWWIPSPLDLSSDAESFRIRANQMAQRLLGQVSSDVPLGIDFPVGEFHWHSSVVQQETGTSLGLFLLPRVFSAGAVRQKQKFNYLVTGPNSGESQAVRVTSDGDEVTFRYPTDFRGANEVKEGRYRYEWWATGSTHGFFVPQGSIASGSFDLGDDSPSDASLGASDSKDPEP
jgi:hypothetical protein